MSEKSFSARTNPLYGGAGSAAGSRTPSWAMKGSSAGPRGSAFSEAASSPPDSPGRGAHYYEPQYDDHVYSVQTPGPGYEPSQGGGSPYRQPPYYVQTPAQSEMHRNGGDHSPFSSAPPSPQHSLGAGTTPYDARSTRSGRSRASMRMGAPPPAIRRIDEEEVDDAGAPLKKPDPAQVEAKKKRNRQLCMGLCSAFLIVALVATAVTLWFVYQPKPPTYSFEGMTINNFTALPGYDFNGLPTNLLYMDMYAHWTAKNRNPTFSAYFNGGVAQAGYGSIPVVSQTGYTRRFWMSPHKKANFSSHFTAHGYPLYNVGPLYFKDLEDRVAELSIRAQLITYVPMLWKLVQPKFTTTALCTVNIDPKYLMFINSTCEAV